jgi:hypothetical protein
MLGASDFPLCSYAGSAAFTQAKNRIETFFTGKYNVLAEDMLDLFDTELDPNGLDQKITEFIAKRPTVEDIFLYYVGHGGSDNMMGFLLAIRASRKGALGVSSIATRNLSKSLANVGNNKKIFIILDCCFAAEIVNSMQSDGMDKIIRDDTSLLPKRGVSLLCSSSRHDVSRIIEEGKITMFTDGFTTALQNGDPKKKKELLTFREIGNLTYEYIKEKNKGEAIRPEVHSPMMPEGDLADLEHFPNYAFISPGIDIAYSREMRGEEISKTIQNNDLLNACRLLFSFVRDFAPTRENFIEVNLISAASNELEENKPQRYSPEYANYRQEKESLYRRILNLVYDITHNGTGLNQN